jgi:hypothetical protein
MENFGTINNVGTINNDGDFNNECGATFKNRGTFTGNPVNYEPCA